MSYLGDITPGQTLNFKFTTVTSSGAPVVLTGTPSLVAWKDASTTSSTAGLTLTASFGGITGSNHVNVSTGADGTFYSAGSDFTITIAAGTAGGVSVVGYNVGEFSISNRSGLRPTVAGRMLDVTATGAAGIDWGNVENQATSVTLSGTSTLALQPTTAGRTLDVTATGAAGIDWGNVENPAAVNNLSSTNISTSQNINTAAVVTTVNGLAASVLTAIADSVWDENISGHIATSSNAGYLLYYLYLGQIGTQAAVDDVSPTSSGFDTTLAALGKPDGFFNDTQLAFLTGALAGQARVIVTSLGTGEVTFDEPFSSAPANGDTFAIKVGHVHTNSQITDSVWAKTMTELSGVPSQTGTALEALTFQFMALRNERVTTTSSDTISNNAGTPIATATVSDSGTVFTKDKYI